MDIVHTYNISSNSSLRITKLSITLFRSSTYSTRYMAPTHTEYSSHHTLSFISCPNTKVLASSGSSSRMHVIHIEKDYQPVSLPQMVSVNSENWQKSASYQVLKNSIYSLLEAHTVADVMILVSNELPMDTGSTFQEAQYASKSIINQALLMEHLEPMAFLTSTGKTVNVDDVSNLKKRSDNINFRKFRSILNASALDKRVTHVPALLFNFCLKLPQYIYDVETDDETSTTASRCSISKSLATSFASVSGTPPSTPTTSSISLRSSGSGFTSPAMKFSLILQVIWQQRRRDIMVACRFWITKTSSC